MEKSKVYFDKDADISILKGKTIAILGYGNQGAAHALNFRDEGLKVIVGNIKDEWFETAKKDEFEVYTINEASAKGDILYVLLPDEVQPEIYKEMIEKKMFRASFNEIWQKVRQYFQERDNNQVLKAEQIPKYKMALIFRWYLGQASNWAIGGDPTRVTDYQVWCGPAMATFNEWVRGTFLEEYTQSGAAGKHLHNHRKYTFYDE